MGLHFSGSYFFWFNLRIGIIHHSEIYSTSKQIHMEKSAKKIKKLLLFFIITLVISGITAIPVQSELNFLLQHSSYLPQELSNYLSTVKTEVDAAALHSPQVFYGFDWLAFAHIVIGIFFLGVLKDPIRNKWVIEAGMIACMLIIPFAFAFGAYRGIPVLWRLIDCSFGLIGIVPLWHIRKEILAQEKKHQFILTPKI